MAQTSSYKLDEKYSFSPDTTRVISKLIADVSAYTTYQDFFASVGMPAVTEFTTDSKHGVTVIDIAPRSKPKAGQVVETLVVHLPMGNPLDQNQQYQLAVIAKLFPDKRVIGFGNPGGGAYAFSFQNLTLFERIGIGLGVRLKPLVLAEQAYLKSEHIQTTIQIGFSYGAFKALASSYYAPVGSVKKVVAIELLSHRRNPIRLLKDFQSSLAPLGAYVERTGLKTFKDARHDAGEGNDYNAGLRRAINISIGMALSLRSGPTFVRKVLMRQPNASISIIWGDESELVDDVRLKKSLAAIQHDFKGRITGKTLPGDKHGLANDVFLHAAILHEALTPVASVVD